MKSNEGREPLPSQFPQVRPTLEHRKKQEEHALC